MLAARDARRCSEPVLAPAPANVACDARARRSLHGCSSACAGDVGDDGRVGERARPQVRPRSRVPARGHEEETVAAEAG
jgi:hypothetical protein